ncbi:ABC transporter substrate-binding protein [Roseomonas indoligenes]|uniref:Putative aliphatic sulfonates-binding protein n=1 Tax=Roseomonas indoligenes TaxID=2820811 RepID=A0A940N3X6_9PROT|nr:ABC transporter substrate-binding protein [Pararoseomonas indoligenes]MBP0496320.1 ABC transporter substrate-binding protein [Pararoseomonas indoligenes]
MNNHVNRRAVLAASGLLAVAGAARAQPRAATLRVGSQRGGLQALLEASNQVKDLPYPVAWSEFQAAQPLLEALNADAVDIGSMGDLNFFSVFANGAAIRAVGATRSDGASQNIVVKADGPIRTVADLRGKRVAAARGGWTHYSLFRILEKAGVKPSEVNIAWLLPSDAALAYRSGAIDAWSVWEPFTSLEVLNFGSRVLADARGLTPSASLLAVSEPALRNKRPQLEDFVRRNRLGWEWANAHLKDYARTTAALIRQPVPVIERAYEVSAQKAVPIDAALLAEFQEAVDRCVEYGIVSRRFKVADGIDASFADA